jgi:cytochrome c-type biogenesis protein
MSDFILAISSCFMAGFLTTAHPCPLATNLAAISLLGGMAAERGKLISITLFFICGYLLSFLLLSVTLSSGVLSIPALSNLLRNYISLLIGPLLIFAGMLQAKLLNTSGFHNKVITKYIRADRSPGIRALPIGFVIALSFCPATAAIFFGLLIPMVIEYDQVILFPAIYAVGASIPIIIAGLLASGRYFTGRVNRWRKVFPLIAGWALIVIGIYISIQRIFLSQ